MSERGSLSGWPEPVPEPAAPERDYEPLHPGSGRGGSWREKGKKLAGPLIAIGALLIKFGAKLKILLVALPKLKLFTTSASMLVSIVAYQLIFGWLFSVGFVLLLLLHELGHVFQLRREGVKASAPMFIPFLGAVISAKSMGDDAAAEARVGLAGPILGSIVTLVPLGIWLATGSPVWQALAFIGFFLNLINLLPILPLDGGRIVTSLLPRGLSNAWQGTERFGMIILLVLLFTGVIGFVLSPLYRGMYSQTLKLIGLG